MMNERWVITSICILICGIYLHFKVNLPFSWLVIIFGVLAFLFGLIKKSDFYAN